MTGNDSTARHAREADWLSVEEAAESILSRASPLGVERVGLVESRGRVLAEAITSAIAHPAWDNSAMDGFAVRSEDIADAGPDSPVTLRVVEDVAAGAFPERSVGRGEAIRVMTGAPIPEGADGVTRLEHTRPDADPGTILIADASDAGRNIRLMGEDLGVGDRPLAAGTPIGSPEIGVLAMLAQPDVPVHRKPVVGILATGDEIADFDELAQVLAGRKIMNSNSYALAAQVEDSGCAPKLLGIARDDPESLREKLEAAGDCDALITSAGLAVGDHDYVKQVLDDMGMEFLFYRVRMRPGSPFTFGTLAGRPVFALPGNPVSAMVTFEILVRPALRKMLGASSIAPSWTSVELGETVEARGWLTHFYRAKLSASDDGGWIARLTGPQGSGILTSMTLADALIKVPADTQLPAGSRVEALLLRR